MRSTAVVALALVSASTPVFSAPSHFADNTDQKNRRELQLLSRQSQPAQSQPAAQAPSDSDDSGALNLGGIARIGGDIIGGIGSLFGGNNKRDVEDIVARAVADEVLARRALPQPTNLPKTRIGVPIWEVNPNLKVARDDTADSEDSGALNLGGIARIGGDIVNGIGSLFGGNNKREVEEIVTRAIAGGLTKPRIGIPIWDVNPGVKVARDDTTDSEDSGALGIGGLARIGGDIVSGIGSLFGGNNKREIEDIVTRAIADEVLVRRDLSGSLTKPRIPIPIWDVNPGPKIARDDTADSEDSGALNIGGVARLGGDIISGIGSLFGGNNKRQDGQDASDEDSGALNLGGIARIGSDIIGGIGSLFGGNNKREVEDIVARAFASELQARDLGLVARQDQEDDSGALNLGGIARIGGDIIGGIGSLFGGNNKREVEDIVARAFTNEMDLQRRFGPIINSFQPDSSSHIGHPFPLNNID